MNIDLRLGDCIEVLKTLPDNSVDSIVVDPPYGIGFMNKEWDNPAKHKELIDREKNRSEERYQEGKSPVKGGFSKGVQPGLAIGGAKEGRWFQEWCELWGAECIRVLKPGGYILSFSAPRTYHRMTTAFEEVGFEIRDQLMWIFGSGFPKSLNIGKAVDKLQGNEREVLGTIAEFSMDGANRNANNHRGIKEAAKEIQHDYGYKSGWDTPVTKGNSEWEGWGTALKPAHEPIVMARKPLSEKTNVENILKWGTGGLNIDGSRIGFKENENTNNWTSTRDKKPEKTGWSFRGENGGPEMNNEGRFPANIIFDEEAGQLLDEQSGIGKGQKKPRVQKGTKDYTNDTWGLKVKDGHESPTYNDMGGASRFFYCPKVSKKERGEGNVHPTVKPIKLMEYLIKLVTRKGGVVMDPFMGSGSTGIAAVKNGYDFIGIEKEEEYLNIAQNRINNGKE